MERSIAFYRDTLGLTLGYHDNGFAKFLCDQVEIHLWAATDQGWKTRAVGSCPVLSGAESFIAGTASCRIGVEGVDELHALLLPRGVLSTRTRASPIPTSARASSACSTRTGT